jgi:hypothetical protein
MAFFGISAHSATDEKTVKKNLDTHLLQRFWVLSPEDPAQNGIGSH